MNMYKTLVTYKAKRDRIKMLMLIQIVFSSCSQENQQTLDVRQKDSCSACQTRLTWPLESYKSNKARHSQEQIHCLVQVLGKEILSSQKIKMAESWDTAVWKLLLIRGMFHCLMKLVITQRALSIFNQTRWKFFFYCRKISFVAEET